MAVEFALNTPLADALNTVLQPKLVEVGWTTGDIDDSALSEYILLMLVNGKTQDQIAVELSNDLLGLEPGDTRGAEFSRWLFEQLRLLNDQINGAGVQQFGAADGSSAVSFGNVEDAGMGADAQGQDSIMGETNEVADSGIPTAPKSMRNGPRVNNRRLMGQLNKAMDRTADPTLHRVRAQQGSGRINSHGRDLPKGPRHQRMNGRGGSAFNNGIPSGAPGGPANALMGMSPQQQMQLFAMYEEQARMMSQILSPQQQQQMFMGPPMGGAMMGPGGPNGFGQQPQQAKSLFERVENNPRRNGGFNKRQQNNFTNEQGQQESQATNQDSSMDVENPQAAPDPATTVCKFNISCTKPDCAFAHQSPAAPPGVTIDVNDICSFGVACKNKKCVARHPSPAQKTTHHAEQDCKFFPNCTNPVCPFRHPSMPLCRNGADCTTTDCKFTHLKTACRFNPCLNPVCPYKHEEGQKRGKFEDKVWTAGGAKEHVSERKFVDENEEEELIKPGSGIPEEQKPAEAGV